MIILNNVNLQSSALTDTKKWVISIHCIVGIAAKIDASELINSLGAINDYRRLNPFH